MRPISNTHIKRTRIKTKPKRTKSSKKKSHSKKRIYSTKRTKIRKRKNIRKSTNKIMKGGMEELDDFLKTYVRTDLPKDIPEGKFVLQYLSEERIKVILPELFKEFIIVGHPIEENVLNDERIINLTSTELTNSLDFDLYNTTHKFKIKEDEFRFIKTIHNKKINQYILFNDKGCISKSKSKILSIPFQIGKEAKSLLEILNINSRADIFISIYEIIFKLLNNHSIKTIIETFQTFEQDFNKEYKTLNKNILGLLDLDELIKILPEDNVHFDLNEKLTTETYYDEQNEKNVDKIINTNIYYDIMVFLIAKDENEKEIKKLQANPIQNKSLLKKITKIQTLYKTKFNTHKKELIKYMKKEKNPHIPQYKKYLNSLDTYLNSLDKYLDSLDTYLNNNPQDETEILIKILIDYIKLYKKKLITKVFNKLFTWEVIDINIYKLIIDFFIEIIKDI